MVKVLIGLGANLGCREENLQRGLELLRQTPGIQVEAVSAWLATRAVGGPAGQPDFLNAAALLETCLSPETLLDRLEQIETQLGRRRTQRWGPRTLDLDILLYDDWVVETERLRIPHPAMAWRRFVLEPAVQVAPEMRHPVIGCTVRELWDHLRTAFPYVAIAGPRPMVNNQLACRVAERTGAQLLSVPCRLKALLAPATRRDEQSSSAPQSRRDALLGLPEGFPALGFSDPAAPGGSAQGNRFCSQDRQPEQSKSAPMAGDSSHGAFHLSEAGDFSLGRLGEDFAGEEQGCQSAMPDPGTILQDILKWFRSLAEPFRSLGEPFQSEGLRQADGWVVSDFWLPQWLRWIDRVWGPAAAEEDRTLWTSLAKEIPAPKLLVFLEAQLKTSAVNPSRSKGHAPAQGLNDWFQAIWRGPLLRIQQPEEVGPDWLRQAAEEVHIAMQAMDGPK